MRGKLMRQQELEHKQDRCLLSAEAFEKLLPGEMQGYDQGFKAAQELMLPLDKQFEFIKFDKTWYELRHSLRRESMLEAASHHHHHHHTHHHTTTSPSHTTTTATTHTTRPHTSPLLIEATPHPFASFHNKSPDELFSLLPYHIKQFVNQHASLKAYTDKREKFTRAVVLWAEWYEFNYERTAKVKRCRQEYEQEALVDRAWSKQIHETDKLTDKLMGK